MNGDMYLNQFALTGGIPSAAALPKVPASVNADLMTDEALQAKLRRGLDDIEAGNARDAAAAFQSFREKYKQKTD